MEETPKFNWEGAVARRHHFVPQCYLKGFCRHRDKPKLYVVDLKSRTHFPRHLKMLLLNVIFIGSTWMAFGLMR
jgi:hypothetical protein